MLGTNDIDFRARPVSDEETQFLASNVVGVGDVTYADIDNATAVVIAGLEPEEECPILFLRLRKQVTARKLPVHALAPFPSRGFEKLAATVDRRPCPARRPKRSRPTRRSSADALATERPLLIVGERLATAPRALSAAAALATRTGAKLAWVPRRAGDRGALEAGCLPNLLPGGRPVAEAAARAEMAAEWNLGAGVLAEHAGPRHRRHHRRGRRRSSLSALIVAGVDPADLADPRLAEDALDNVDFLISFEVRGSAVTRRADVVFPVAPVVEKAGTFVDWEGRTRTFDAVLTTTAMSDARVLDALAKEFDVELGCADARRSAGDRAHAADRGFPTGCAGRVRRRRPDSPAAGEAILATWHQLLDLGSLTDGDEFLAGTARPPVYGSGRRSPVRSVSQTETRSRSAPNVARSRCPRPWSTWPTVSSGCRRTRPAPPSVARSASPPVRSCR